MSIEKLLPLQAARERHAQRLYHEKLQAYELALTAYKNNLEKTKLLNQKHKEILTTALHTEANNNAYQKQNIFDNAAIEKVRAQQAETETVNMKLLLDEAHEAMQSARQIYLQKVRTHEKFKKISKIESSQKIRLKEMLNEINTEDDFLVSKNSLITSGVKS